MSTAAKPRQRTKPPEERRLELMNAAQRLFLEHGVGPTTVEQITSGAHVAKGTFYLYFSSKEDVLAALGERFAEQHLTGIEAAVAMQPAEDWKGKLATWARACAAGYLDAIHLHDLVFYSTRPATREGLVDNMAIDHLAGLLQAGMDAGAWSIGEPRCTAVFLFSGLHGAVDDAYTKEEQVDRHRLAGRLERLFFRAAGMEPDKPAGR